MSDSLRLHGLWPTRLLCPWDSPGKNAGGGFAYPPPKDLPDPGIEPKSPALAGNSLPSEPPGEPRKTWVQMPDLLFASTHVSLNLLSLSLPNYKMGVIMPTLEGAFN